MSSGGSADQVDPHPGLPGTGAKGTVQPEAGSALAPVWPAGCQPPSTGLVITDQGQSGKARLSLFEEIVKLTPFNGQRQGRIILFMTLSSLPLGGTAL